MRFTLKEHQVEAVAEILDRMRLAKKGYHEDGVLSQFALSATTSAGKTVISAAVVEALFFGSEEFDMEPDPGATVLWFSDDPSLNVQSMARFNQASEKLGVDRTQIIDSGYSGEILAPNMVYFLNAQKLREGSRLVRGASSDTEAQGSIAGMPAPDLVQRTIYDVFRNTIEKPGRTLYLFLDEAHRGMKPVRDRTTVVQRVINGHAGAPPMPIVFGISATVDRFEKTMSGIDDRRRERSVTVDAQKVMDSGLLKESITLDLPGEVGDFDTTMLRRAVEMVKRYSEEWDTYARAQGIDPVLPLLVVQVANNADEAYLSNVIQVITENWDITRTDGIAHVFGSHTDEQVGMRTIPYIEPHRVQDQTWVRVLLAKESISEGWDCPRAEVLASFRVRRDRDAVHQLFGRMMRPPLAHRVPGNGFLNTVTCFVPNFDEDTAKTVVSMLARGETRPEPGGGEDTGLRVLINPVVVLPNPELPAEVPGVFESLPSYTVPSGHGSPMRRLDQLSAALTHDFPGSNESNKTVDELVGVLRGGAARYAETVAKAKDDVLTMTGTLVSATVGQDGTRTDTYTAEADARAVDDAYTSAFRVLARAPMNKYANELADAYENEDEVDIMDVQASVAALARIPEIVKHFFDEVEKRARDLSAEYQSRIAGLNDQRRDDYRRIEGLSSTPEPTDIQAPDNDVENTSVQIKDARGGKRQEMIPAFDRHLLATEKEPKGQDGRKVSGVAPYVYPATLNNWETHVLTTEQARDEHVGWYRNPAVGNSSAAVTVPWQDAQRKWKPMRPDFVFFVRRADGTIGASIIDPHGYHLSDAVPKLKGLADYAEKHGDAYVQILSVAETDGTYRSLDMKSPHVREAVQNASDARSLYLDDMVARDYR